MSSSNKKMDKALKYTFVFSLLVILVGTIVWANQDYRYEMCTAVNVHFRSDGTDSTSLFLHNDGIIAELKKEGINPVGKPISHINLAEIKARLSKKDLFEGVQCVIEGGDKLGIYVSQMTPVMRVYNSRGQSWYYNKDGKRIQANLSFRSDVPVVMADFKKNGLTYKHVLPVAEYVIAHPEYKSYVTCIEMRDSDNIYIVPNVVGQVINIGNCDNLDNKFAKVKQFYEKVLAVKGYDFYDTISVKWQHQIVANRCKAKAKSAVEYNSDEDETAAEVNVDASELVEHRFINASVSENSPSADDIKKKSSATSVSASARPNEGISHSSTKTGAKSTKKATEKKTDSKSSSAKSSAKKSDKDKYSKTDSSKKTTEKKKSDKEKSSKSDSSKKTTEKKKSGKDKSSKSDSSKKTASKSSGVKSKKGSN